MEDWQQWQIRADQIASALRQEVEGLEKHFFGGPEDGSFRGFWPQLRDLKERVRVAPAIRLEDKLELERKLRDLGSKAYKAQEAAYARSSERKTELLSIISQFRESAAKMESPRDLRVVRRDLDGVRSQFDSGTPLVSADRQAVWESWREANQDVWQRLTDRWTENENHLREILTTARTQAEAGSANAARQTVGRFFESLRTHEARQTAIVSLKAEADAIRREAERAEERKMVQQAVSQATPSTHPLEGWKAEVDRNREVIQRLSDEVAGLELQMKEADSILEQAMIRGNIVDKRRKLKELERTTRALGQRIEQSEEVSLISAG